jgi:hypothetical protein
MWRPLALCQKPEEHSSCLFSAAPSLISQQRTYCGRALILNRHGPSNTADPQTTGKKSPPNAIKFSGKDGFRELAVYFRDSLNVISGDLTAVLHITNSFLLSEAPFRIR